MNVSKVITKLKKLYPRAKYYLNVSTPLELFVGVILSAQCTDEVVNRVISTLFKKYKTAKDYFSVPLSELEKDISSITFFRNKAKNIQASCRILAEKYNGKLPDMMEELIGLPGIGRKSANVILINAFNKITGIVVDTHVIRVSFRLGWTKNKDAEKIEQDLMQIIPKEHWKDITYLLKEHGKAFCKAPVPICSQCKLNSLCQKQGVEKFK